MKTGEQMLYTRHVDGCRIGSVSSNARHEEEQLIFHLKRKRRMKEEGRENRNEEERKDCLNLLRLLH